MFYGIYYMVSNIDCFVCLVFLYEKKYNKANGQKLQ